MFHELAFGAMNEVTLLLVIKLYIYFVNDLPYHHLSTASIKSQTPRGPVPWVRPCVVPASPNGAAESSRKATVA